MKTPTSKTLRYLTLSYVWGTERMERESRIKPVMIIGRTFAQHTVEKAPHFQSACQNYSRLHRSDT